VQGVWATFIKEEESLTYELPEGMATYEVGFAPCYPFFLAKPELVNMKQIKRIDLTLVQLFGITCFSLFQVIRNYHSANRTLSIMAFIAFAIFYLMTLIYLYVVYIRKPRLVTSCKWRKEKWVRIGGIIACAYFLLLVLFPVLSKNEWVYYGLTGSVFIWFVLYIIVAGKFRENEPVVEKPN
jgi:hypothetical protein